MRDDFTKPTIDIMAKRVGYRCSNPNCRQLTSGPKTQPDKAINVGEAAHITAASPDGPRFDPMLSSQERKSIDNGIWLCSKCAKLVDSDTTKYPIDLLQRWKRLSEEAALLEIEGKPVFGKSAREKDIHLIRFYSQCLDRPAFQDAFLRELEVLPNFDKAVEDTITAINTGCLRDRKGKVLDRAKGKSYLTNHEWREKMDIIVTLLRMIRERYRSIEPVRSRNDFARIGDWMDTTRDQIIQIFNEICAEADIPHLQPPRMYWPHMNR